MPGQLRWKWIVIISVLLGTEWVVASEGADGDQLKLLKEAALELREETVAQSMGTTG